MLRWLDLPQERRGYDTGCWQAVPEVSSGCQLTSETASSAESRLVRSHAPSVGHLAVGLAAGPCCPLVRVLEAQSTCRTPALLLNYSSASRPARACPSSCRGRGPESTGAGPAHTGRVSGSASRGTKPPLPSPTLSSWGSRLTNRAAESTHLAFLKVLSVLSGSELNP